MLEHFFTCPYCFEEISFLIDGSESRQSYIEDCEVCCNPIEVEIHLSEGSILGFSAKKCG